MNNPLNDISLLQLAFAFIPVLLSLVVFYRWKVGISNASQAIVRMLIQLLLVGYILGYLFNSDSAWVLLTVLFVMVLVSSWISLGVVKPHRKALMLNTSFGLLIGGGFTLFVVVLGVLQVDPWRHANILIPLAGMTFANAMTSISLASERVISELSAGQSYEMARNKAFRSAMIPVINSLLAVGVVSLPGMMTGQILSGVSPFLAARYQIVVMCMMFSANALSCAVFMSLSANQICTLINSRTENERSGSR